jgi:hypothetical protein
MHSLSSLAGRLIDTLSNGLHHGVQVIPHPLPFSYQVLLGGFDRDFYYHNGT